MPNWCDTSYKCVGDSKEIRELNSVLKYLENCNTSILPNGFGKMWLGNLIYKLDGDWEALKCRGEIIDFSVDGNVLTINQQTAWCEQEDVRKIIEKAYPSIKVYYMEQEPGCEVFDTNDASGEYFPERYLLDFQEDCEYFETIDEAAKFVSKKIGHEIESNVTAIHNEISKYIEEHEKRNEDIFFSFYEINVRND